jgi:hypothetical protein
MGATFPRDTVDILLNAFNSIARGEISNASADAERG